MVISHKYKYLFVELPLTGSTAVSKELREQYDGSLILAKHSTYLNFLADATEEERSYFVFSAVRNPLDQAASHYFKYKSNHKNRFTDPERLSQNRGPGKYVDLKKFRYVCENNADFADFFLKFYKIPYNNWSSLSHKKFDFVMRFENLQNDFAAVLELIGIEPRRPLPQRNRTAQKEKDFAAYFNTPVVINRAMRVFGPYMHEWGYDFPPEWGYTGVPWWNRIEFEFFNIFRNFYWRYLRYRI